MTTKMLIYESAVPVSATRHATWSVEAGSDFGFSRGINAVPLMAVEFPQAAREFAIVFAGTSGALMPAAILGMGENRNLYVSDKGEWLGRYVPAFVRRYPFVFASRDEGKTLTLCIDEAFAGCNTEGRGERLFDDAGRPTPYVEGILKFLQEYQAQFTRTQSLCARLHGLDLLEPMQAQVTLETGERKSLTGFMAVNRERLKKLRPDDLADLARTDALELVYLHLHSLQNLGNMRDRIAAAHKPAAAAESSTTVH